MKRQRVLVWTGGRPTDLVAEEIGRRTASLPDFPAPDPLRCGAIIIYQWGETTFEIAATACSVRVTPWGAAPMTWLQCKARQTREITPGEPIGMMMVLVPAHYVTAIQPGPPFHITPNRQPSDDIGVFPPTHPAPANALPLEQVEAALAELLSPELN